MKHRILVVDDDESSREGLALLLSTWGYDVQQAADGREALEGACAFRPAVIIVDMVMPGLDGLGLLKAIHADMPAVAVILLTGHTSIESAVSAMKEGAYDYLTKPVDVARLRVLLEKAMEKAAVIHEVTFLRRQLKQSRGLGPLLGTSPAMQEVYGLIELAGPSPAPVLISGETGTGKELVPGHDARQQASGARWARV